VAIVRWPPVLQPDQTVIVASVTTKPDPGEHTSSRHRADRGGHRDPASTAAPAASRRGIIGHQHA